MIKKEPIADSLTFTAEVAALEKRLFPGDLDAANPGRMKNGSYSWLYRPSHHAETGLITRADIAGLSVPGKRLLSIGAHPAYLEQLLCVMGIPAHNIFIADKDPAVALADGLMDRTIFDATGIWPDIGMFDLIIFPESLCMAVGDGTKSGETTEDPYPKDKAEASSLAFILGQAFTKLKPNGEIRANGPQSHPNVVKLASDILTKEGHPHAIDYDRFFMTIRRKINVSE